MSHFPIITALALLPLSVFADFYAVTKTTSADGSPAYEASTWPSAQAFATDIGRVSMGARPQSVTMECLTVSPNGDLYSVQSAAWHPGYYEVYRYRDAFDFLTNTNTVIGVAMTAGVVAGVTFDADGQFYSVHDTTTAGVRSYTVKKWASVTDFIYEINPTVLGTRKASGVQGGIEFIDGRLYSTEQKTANGAPVTELWDWGASFTGFINKTGTLVGTRTGTEVAAVFSRTHGAPPSQTTVARSPMWPWLGNRLPATTPGSPSGWAPVNAFPNLTFEDPVKMIPQPNSNRLWVICRQGYVWWFENNAATATKTLALNHYDSTMGREDCGMLGLAFHPEFGQAGSPNGGYLYIWYNYRPTGNSVSVGINYNRLSRFTLADGATTIDPASEFVMINQLDEHSWHNGGDMFFGPDGFLYVTNGDEGGAEDQYNNSQKIDGGLFSGVLRIDVDCKEDRSHPIRRQPQAGGITPAGWPATFSQGYFIPNDNPWQNTDGTILEEFWAIGLRSPHRMTRDPVTGTVFIGDVGQNAREEIDVLAKGANFQWNYREGDVAGTKPKPGPLVGADTPPVWAYSRDQGDGCVIGGHVYRGPSHAADLGGKYICGDYVSGRIWAMTWQGVSPVQVTQIASVLGSTLSGFGLDHANELYLMSLGAQGKILKLTRATTQQPPATLSATGVFSDTASLTPAAGVLPFTVNSPLWSDNAVKQCWIALPNNGAPYDADETIAFKSDSEWSYPAGTVLVKHFDLPVDDRDPTVRKRIETRITVKTAAGEWYGIGYKWRADGSDADLLAASATQDIAIATADGGTRVQSWYYPSRTDCNSCHTPASTQVLGLRTWQLNGDFMYPGATTAGNQLQVWSDIGMFDQTLTPAQIGGFMKSVSIHDTAAPLETRVRSYLDSNCAHCHRPGGTHLNFDARFNIPLAQQGIVNAAAQYSLGISGAHVVTPGSLAQSVLYLRANSLDNRIKMPPLGKNVVDAGATAVVAQWINSLAPLAAPYPLTATPTGYGVVTLCWTPQSTNHTGFRIERSLDGTNWQLLATPADAASITDSSVAGATTYRYRIAATNGATVSPWSNTATATTWPVQGSWADWQRLHPLGGQNTPLQNPDGDTAPNLLEFALAADPASGTSAQDRFYLVSNTNGGLDAKVIRPANASGITYTLVASSTLSNPMSWSAVTIVPSITTNQDGTQTLTYANLDTMPLAASAGRGFVRLHVTLATTGETAHTATWFWDHHTFETGTRTFAPTMLKPERFSAIPTSSSTPDLLDVTSSAGGGSVVARFDPAKPAYIEIASYTLSGNRFDIDLARTSARTLALQTASPRNTLIPMPGMSGYPFIAREHWTLGELFPPSQWTASNTSSRADRVQFYDPSGAWIVMWLAKVNGTPRWVLQGDASLADRAGTVVAPGTGIFVRKVGPSSTVLLSGVLRENEFALPVAAGTTLVADGWPIDQSPASRWMFVTQGFIGSRISANADQFMRWSQDISPTNSEGYQSHYLLDAGSLRYWTPVGNASLPDESETFLFTRHRAAFVRLKTAHPGWKLPSPWLP